MLKFECKKFEDYFNLQFKLYKFVGIRFNSKDDGIWKKWANICYFAFCYVTFLTNILMIFVFLILPETSVERKIGAFSTMIAEISHQCKMHFIYLNLVKIKKMLKILGDLFDQQMQDQVVNHQYLTRNGGVIYRFSKILISVSYVFMSIPFITSLSIYLNDNVWVPLYPVECWFPFNSNNYYLPVYFYSLLIGLIYSVNMIAGDTLFLMILTHVTEQLKQLSKDYSKLKEHGIKLNVLVNRQITLLQ